MKYLQMYNINVKASDSYCHHLQEAVCSLNASATHKRVEGIPSHQIERSAIIKAMMTVFPDKTEELIVVDLIHAPSITPAAVNDFMYFHHHTFPGNKACLVPPGMQKMQQLGLHIVRRMEGNLFTGKGLDVQNSPFSPQTDICYYNSEQEQWVTFRVPDTEIYQVTLEFKTLCIANGLKFLRKGKNSDFEEAAQYLDTYRELNNAHTPLLKQYGFIGWSQDRLFS